MTPSQTHAAARAVTDTDNARLWWKGAVIYQVYPRSFKDSNGDGIGDLQGCIDGLDHIAALGADAVWISPFFKSPMDDFGYDVADYLDVDPMFGTLDDFDALVEKAHALGIKVIIDQVYSHTSDQHAWFIESRSNRDNPKADWYVWADPKPDGSPPSNWQSVFGGPSWEWDNTRRQYYLHNFLTSQPDLNLHNREVQDAILDVARFWLDRGVDGFRLDALNFSMHDPAFRDNPPARVFARPPTRPFDFQDHKYNQSHPDITGFLERIRGVMDEYGARFTVAEVGGEKALEEMKAFTEGESRLNSAYSFAYLYADSLSAERVRENSAQWPGYQGEGWPSWAFSNHDAPRAISRWAEGQNTDAFAKFNMMLLLSLRGNAIIYQGEELGLVQAHVPFEKLQDPEAIANWPETLGRDGARTPMPWDADQPHAGFSTAEPWLPVDPAHFKNTVKRQTAGRDSVFAVTQSLVNLRKSSPALSHGQITFLETPANILAFIRSDGDDRMLCVFNIGQTPTSWTPDDAPRWDIQISLGLENTANIPDILDGRVAYIAALKP